MSSATVCEPPRSWGSCAPRCTHTRCRTSARGKTLELVDRYVQTLPDYAMATAAYGVLDPESGRVQIASAGHLPPMVVGGAEPRIIELAPAPPLGAFPYSHCAESELMLAPGETLVLYTDGLVERPGSPLTTSLEELLALLADSTSVEDLCERAVTTLVPVTGLRDDVALVAIQTSPIPGGARPRAAGRAAHSV